MRIVISSGHGRHVAGASGYIDEHPEAVRVVDRVVEALRMIPGVNVIGYEDKTSRTQQQNLENLVAFHNSHERDLDISVHFNSTTPGTKPVGTEVWYVTQQALAGEVSTAIADAGHLIDRGGKHTNNLYFLNHTEMPAILIEVCFVSSKADTDLYEQNFDAICTAIARTVAGECERSERPEKPLPPFDPRTVEQIVELAVDSDIASYNWDDRGVAPAGYTNGMAVAFGYVVHKWHLQDSAAHEMAKAAGDPELDALAWYADEFNDLGMHNNRPGLNSLRHLFVLMFGLGMRETSGEHCCGRDQSADNTDAMTCEAGLFQMSWNASSCHPDMQTLMDQYMPEPNQCQLPIFEDGVSCSSADWECYGSGPGYDYQELAKNCPQFAVETAALCLRNRRQHFGPINRKEAELRVEADELLHQVERLVAERHNLIA